ncbi:MAG: hypothetical protein KME26_24095 [Oscillatoria princeps RMCB-10]|jgi:hypothetical protein|nr:hypothetical protein [Oscillatoria princeps RMCB-10]
MTSITSSHHPQTESEVTIAVTEVIGDTVCIASGDGQKVFERIAAALKQDKKVTVSFKDFLYGQSSRGCPYNLFPNDLDLLQNFSCHQIKQ